MAEIQLSKGKVAVVDDTDFDWLNRWSWHFCERGYAERKGLKSEGTLFQKNIKMHRQILNLLDKPQEVDHINHNPLDNRRSNLRGCSSSQNKANLRLRKDSSSGFKGIKYHKDCFRRKPWEVRIVVNGLRVSLGYFFTKEQAALAYNESAVKVYGEFACLNEVANA